MKATIGICLLLSVLVVASLAVLEAVLLLGSMVAILQMSGLLIPAAMRIALANVQLQGARVAFDRMYDFTALAPEYELDEEDQQQVVHAFDFGFISSVATLVSVYGL